MLERGRAATLHALRTRQGGLRPNDIGHNGEPDNGVGPRLTLELEIERLAPARDGR